MTRGFASLSERKRRALGSAGGKLAQARRRAHRFSPAEARAAAQRGWLARWPEPWRNLAIRAGGDRALRELLQITRPRLHHLMEGTRQPRMLERRAINELAIALGLPPMFGPPGPVTSSEDDEEEGDEKT